MTLKWKRPEPGHYVCGTWHVKGVGTSWDLYNGRKHIHSGTTKKECQQMAENSPKVEQPEDEVPVPSVSRRVSKITDLDSVLASLRLEINNLALRIGSMDAGIQKSTESSDGLTKAILLLGRHLGKLSK